MAGDASGASQGREILQGSVRSKQPHDDFFAVLCRERGDPQVNPAIGNFHEETTVLGRAALGDVHVGENIDTRGDGILEGFGDADVFAQYTIAAKTNGRVAEVRLDMDIAAVPFRAGVDYGGDYHDRRCG